MPVVADHKTYACPECQAGPGDPCHPDCTRAPEDAYACPLCGTDVLHPYDTCPDCRKATL